MEMKTSIQELFNSSELNTVDLYVKLYVDFIKEAENPQQIFKYILEESTNYSNDNNKLPTIASRDLVNEVGSKYYDLLYEIVKMLVKNNFDEIQFYETLFSYTFLIGVFHTTDIEKGILLYFLSEKIPFIPYYRAEHLEKMSDEEYGQIIDRIDPQISKTLFFLNRGFPSKTEEASQIYQVLSSIDDKKSAIVYLSVLISILKGGKQEDNPGY